MSADTPEPRGPRGRYSGFEDKREAILSAAFDVFSSHGYARGSIQQVADRVGMSQTALLHYYPKKRDLLLAVLERRDAIGDQDAPPDADFETFVDAVVARADANRTIPGLIGLYTVLSGEAVTEDNPGRAYVTRRLADLRASYVRRFQAMAAAGRLAPGVSPEIAASTLIGLWDGLQQQWLLEPDAVDVPAALRAYLDAVVSPGAPPPAPTSTARPDPSHLVSRDVREHNLGLVLAVLDAKGPMARSELADETGLVRGAITTIVKDLIGIGLVRPVGSRAPREPGQVGRSMAALELDGSRHSVLAVQFGLDEFQVGAVDLAGRVLLQEDDRERTPLGHPETVADQIAARVRSATARLEALGAPVAHVRVIAQAPIASNSETVWIAVNLGWRDVDLGAMLRERIAEPPFGLRIVNDAKMSTYAEWVALRRRFTSLQIDDIVYLKSDTGIGGGVITAGRPLVARNGLAFEPGHQVVERDGPQCPCGQRGCLEMLAGPDIVLERAGLTPLADAEGVPAALAEFVRRVEGGEARAVESWRIAAGWIRTSIAGLVLLLQPQAVVLGGYWSRLAADLLPEAELVNEVLDAGGIGHEGAVLGSAVGSFSAVIGALTVARHELLRTPSLLA